MSPPRQALPSAPVTRESPETPADANVAIPSRMRDRRRDQAHRERRAGPLAEPQVEVEDRLAARAVSRIDAWPGSTERCAGDQARRDARLRAPRRRAPRRR